MTIPAIPAPAHIYQLEITLCEHVFFSSREVSAFFQTEPVIGNYALAYALGLAQSPYRATVDSKTGKQVVRYKLDLEPLNERGIYVTPATLLNEPIFALTEFNAQTDTYWFAFGNNAIVTRGDHQRAHRDGPRWRIVNPSTGEGSLVSPNNFPQHGRIKMLARGNHAVAYVISANELDTGRLPSYIRLGKFTSKAAISVKHTFSQPEQRSQQRIDRYLNPNDLQNTDSLGTYDLLSIHPAPLIHHAEMSGWFHGTPDGVWLPSNMRFGVQHLP